MSDFQSSADGTLAQENSPAKKFPNEAAKKLGRPPGKRSNPDFEQITAYIRKDTHRDVKIGLLQAGEGQEFSELVEQLLSEWLRLR